MRWGLAIFLGVVLFFASHVAHADVLRDGDSFTLFLGNEAHCIAFPTAGFRAEDCAKIKTRSPDDYPMLTRERLIGTVYNRVAGGGVIELVAMRSTKFGVAAVGPEAAVDVARRVRELEETDERIISIDDGRVEVGKSEAPSVATTLHAELAGAKIFVAYDVLFAIDGDYLLRWSTDELHADALRKWRSSIVPTVHVDRPSMDATAPKKRDRSSTQNKPPTNSASPDPSTAIGEAIGRAAPILVMALIYAIRARSKKGEATWRSSTRADAPLPPWVRDLHHPWEPGDPERPPYPSSTLASRKKK